MTATRHYYEAQVLVVPQGRSAHGVQTAMRDMGLDGVLTVTEAHDTGFEIHPLASHGWAAPATLSAIADAIAGADIVILLATDLAEVDEETCREAADAARGNGSLVAALIVGSKNRDMAEANTAMATLRAAVDMLVVVREARLAAPFLDVLRGGLRDPQPVG